MKVSFIACCLLFFFHFSWSVAQDDVQRRYDLLFMEAMVQRQAGHTDASFDLLSRCRDLRPEASEVWFFMAQYLTHLKQADQALDYFKRAAELEPQNATYMETLAQAYVNAERWTDAIATVEQLYALDKSRQDLLEMLYQLYVQTQDYEQAIGVLERMEAIDGKSERIAVTKSGLYMQMDDSEAALNELQELARQHPNDLNYQTLYANTLMMNEREQEAYKLLEKVLTQEPQNTRAQMSLRTYYLMQQDSVRADSLMRQMLLNPQTERDERVYLLRQEIAASEQAGGDSTHVLSLFHELLSQPNPDAEMAEFCAAYMNLKKMPRDTVSSMLEYVLELAPDNASARLQLVQYAWDEERDDRVIDLCRAARQYNPDEMAFYYYQGMAFYRQEDKDGALEAFRNGISVINQDSSPDIVASFFEVMGDLLHQKGMTREAFAAYDSCLQWKPDDIGCLNNYAYYLSLENTQLSRAEQMSLRTIKAEPKNSTYLDTYAWILFMKRRYSEARIYIDQALQNDSVPGAVILEHAGDIYALCGDMERAVELWQQALDNDPDNKMLRRKLKRKKYIK